MAFNGSSLFVTHDTGSIYSIDKIDGEIEWRQAALKHRRIRVGTLINDYIAFGDYDGYVFSIANTLKDVSYINEFFNAEKDYGKLAQLFLDIYQSSYTDGKGNNLLSNRLDPTHP